MTGDMLVTGGTGFVGRHLVTKLVKEGYHIRCLVRKTSEVSYLKSLGAQIIYGDITEKELPLEAVKNVAAVFHLAGKVGVSQSIKEPGTTFLVNTMGTLTLLEQIRCSGGVNCLVIYLSSDRVYGNPKSDIVTESEPTIHLEPYGASKLSAENLCQAYSRTYSIPFVIIRGANIYGPGQTGESLIPSVIHQIMSNAEYITTGNPDIYRNFVYVEDMIEALYLALLRRLQAENSVFNISEGVVRVGEIIDILSGLSLKYLGRRFRVVHNTALFRPMEIECKKYELDCSKAQQTLGWHPKYSLKEGLEQTFRFAYQRKVGANSA